MPNQTWIRQRRCVVFQSASTLLLCIPQPFRSSCADITRNKCGWVEYWSSAPIHDPRPPSQNKLRGSPDEATTPPPAADGLILRALMTTLSPFDNLFPYQRNYTSGSMATPCSWRMGSVSTATAEAASLTGTEATQCAINNRFLVSLGFSHDGRCDPVRVSSLSATTQRRNKVRVFVRGITSFSLLLDTTSTFPFFILSFCSLWVSHAVGTFPFSNTWRIFAPRPLCLPSPPTARSYSFRGFATFGSNECDESGGGVYNGQGSKIT